MSRKALLLSSALFLAGCQQDKSPPPALAPGDVPTAFEQASSTAAIWPTPDWWQGFGSTELTSLETAAQAGTPDSASSTAPRPG